MPRRHHFIAVAGESQHQPTLRALSEMLRLLGRADRHFEATLVPEPSKPLHEYAVGVKLPDGTKVGDLSPEVAQQFQRRIADMPQPVYVRAELRGGDADREMISVVVDFSGVAGYGEGVLEQIGAPGIVVTGEAPQD